MTDSDPVGKVNAQARALNWQSRADASLSFRQPELLALRDIWNNLSGDGRLPSRAALTARMLKPFLPHVTILEMLPAGPGKLKFVHRYVGTAVTRYFGELTGLSLEDFLPPERLPATESFLEAVIETRRALRVITHFQIRDYLYGEILIMPLADDGAVPNKLMSASYFTSGAELAEEIRRR